MMIPYKPKQLLQCDLDLLHELVLSKRVFPLSKKDPSHKIRFVRSSSFTEKNDNFVISLDVNKEKVDLTLWPARESLLARRLLEMGGIENFPEEFVSAIRAFYSQEIINAFEGFFDLPIALWNRENAEPIPLEKREISFELFHEEGIVEAQGTITVSLPLVHKLIALVTKFPALKEEHFKELVLQGEIIVGGISLLIDELKQLEPGGLIFLQEPSALTTGKASFLFEETQKIPIGIDPQQLIELVLPLEHVSLAPFEPDPPFPKEKLQHASEQIDPEPRKINIRLDLSAGTLSLSLEELLLLIKNKKTNHPATLLRPLKILLQGKHIGTGELTSIHGQHALFITQIREQFIPHYQTSQNIF